MHHLIHLRDRYPGDLLGTLGPPPRRGRPKFIETTGAFGDVGAVGESFGDRQMSQRQCQRQIGSRGERDMNPFAAQCTFSGGALPWIDHDQTPARGGRFQMLHERRHGFCRIATEHQYSASIIQIGHRERKAPVHTKRTQSRFGGCGHTEPAAVVNIGRPQRDPREFT
ncbi:Uncharacterised protein [Mycobacteroides abscessus subsp. abscessus]|nr:Uncharacterised protein [Mycobacteroides abscessus subsp. abscessus]